MNRPYAPRAIFSGVTTRAATPPATAVGSRRDHVEFAARGGLQRLADGIARRFACLLRPFVASEDPWEYERALEAALTQVAGTELDASALGETVTALVQLGQTPWARAMARDALARLSRHGLASDATGRPSLWCTSRLLAGWLELARRDREAGEVTPGADRAIEGRAIEGRAIEQCAAALAGALRTDGAIAWPKDAGSLDGWAPPAVQLGILPPFLRASELLHRVDWSERAARVVARFRRDYDLARIEAAPELAAWGVWALAELSDWRQLPEVMVRDALALAAARATAATRRVARTGATPSARALSLLARVSFQLGERDTGERLFSMCHAANRSAPTIAGTLALLSAALVRARTSFNFAALPDEIAEGDGRCQAVRRFVESLPLRATLVDAGCGSGRMLQHVAQWRPDLRLVGVDGCPALLERLPGSMAAKMGELLRLPLASGSCDAVMAIEVLEHAILPRTAVEELARVTRPGGRLLIIDKERRRQPLSHHQPWERWFLPGEVAAWLAEHADDVRTESLSHGDPRRGAGLFLAWRGRRRPAEGAVRRPRAAA